MYTPDRPTWKQVGVSREFMKIEQDLVHIAWGTVTKEASVKKIKIGSKVIPGLHLMNGLWQIKHVTHIMELAAETFARLEKLNLYSHHGIALWFSKTLTRRQIVLTLPSQTLAPLNMVNKSPTSRKFVLLLIIWYFFFSGLDVDWFPLCFCRIEPLENSWRPSWKYLREWYILRYSGTMSYFVGKLEYKA